MEAAPAEAEEAGEPARHAAADIVAVSIHEFLLIELKQIRVMLFSTHKEKSENIIYEYKSLSPPHNRRKGVFSVRNRESESAKAERERKWF